MQLGLKYIVDKIDSYDYLNLSVFSVGVSTKDIIVCRETPLIKNIKLNFIKKVGIKIGKNKVLYV